MEKKPRARKRRKTAINGRRLRRPERRPEDPAIVAGCSRAERALLNVHSPIRVRPDAGLELLDRRPVPVRSDSPEYAQRMLAFADEGTRVIQRVGNDHSTMADSPELRAALRVLRPAEVWNALKLYDADIERQRARETLRRRHEEAVAAVVAWRRQCDATNYVIARRIGGIGGAIEHDSRHLELVLKRNASLTRAVALQAIEDAMSERTSADESKRVTRWLLDVLDRHLDVYGLAALIVDSLRWAVPPCLVFASGYTDDDGIERLARYLLKVANRPAEKTKLRRAA